MLQVICDILLRIEHPPEYRFHPPCILSLVKMAGSGVAIAHIYELASARHNYGA